MIAKGLGEAAGAMVHAAFAEIHSEVSMLTREAGKRLCEASICDLTETYGHS